MPYSDNIRHVIIREDTEQGSKYSVEISKEGAALGAAVGAGIAKEIENPRIKAGVVAALGITGALLGPSNDK